MAHERWTREQTVIVFNLYCKIPFNKANSSNPEIIKVAKAIGRSVNSVKMKVGNFASFDPALKAKGIVGLANASKLDAEVWHDFQHNWTDLVFESEKLIAKYLGEDNSFESISFPEGKEKERLVKTRVNQTFFRQSVLSAYNSICCITGINLPELIIASHIIPWNKADSKTEKVNPSNGLCLNALHDKAFDKGLITITPDFKVQVSNKLLDSDMGETKEKYFLASHGKKIVLPDKFVPKQAFLEYHNQYVFEDA